MKKNIFVVFSGYPLAGNRFAEKLRMALGLTLNDDNAVNLLFLGGARRALGTLNESAAGMLPVAKHTAMMTRLGVKFHAEEGDAAYAPGLKINPVRLADAAGLLNNADVIIH